MCGSDLAQGLEGGSATTSRLRAGPNVAARFNGSLEPG